LQPVSSFEWKQVGEGAFELIGEMSFDTAAKILTSSERDIAQCAQAQVNLSQVSKADSAGLALLLEWKAQAKQRKAVIRFVAVPDSLLAIANTTEVIHFISD
jgi:phospholipid transport system transporter-binding protein